MGKTRYQNLIAYQRAYPHKALPKDFCLRGTNRFLVRYYQLLALGAVCNWYCGGFYAIKRHLLR